MRLLSRAAFAAAAVATTVAFAAPPASAAEPCEEFHIGSCYVHDPNGSYTCTLLYYRVGNAEVCLFEWQP